MRNNVTLSRLKADKLPLLIAFGITFLLDLFALITIFIKGTPWDYAKINVYMMIIDIIFVVFTLISNPRFKYFKTIVFSYSFLMILLTIIFSSNYNNNGNYVVCTDTASTFMWLFRIASIVCIIYLSRICSKSVKRVNKIKKYATLGVEGGFLLAYSIFLFINGIFGQGISYRDVIYCQREAISILDGNSSKASIASAFNYYSIDYMQNNILLEDIDTLYIKNGNVQILDEVSSNNDYNDVSILVSKDGIDSFKNELWEHNFKTLSNNALVNDLTLDENEVCITFTYDQSYTGERLDTWFGKSGDIIKDDYFSTGYAKHSDENNAEDLYWNYENNNQNIMVVNDPSGNTIINTKIEKSLKASVEFNDVYRLNVTDNDTLYNLNAANVANYGNYYYATKNTISKFVTNFKNSSDNRSGMTYSYVCNGTSYDDAKLCSFITTSNNNSFNLTVTYEYKIPTLEISTDRDSYIYGDNVVLFPNAKVENDVNVSYVSYNSSNDGNSLIIDKPFAGSNTERVYFTLSKTDSSLIKELTKDITYTVSKKEISVNWTVNNKTLTNNEITYDSEDHILKGTIPVASFVTGDVDADYAKSIEQNIDVGTYDISLNETDLKSTTSKRNSTYKLSDLYVISNPSYSIEIKQKEISVDWSNLSFTYDGNSHKPTVTTTKCYPGDSYSFAISNSQTNAGTYKSSVTISNKNYTISNSTNEYTINPRELTITWTETSLTYNGNYLKPIFDVSNACEGDNLNISQSTGNKNAGKNYTSKLTCGNDNYVIKSNASTTYTINPRELTITWTETSFTYNGAAQQPTYIVEGKCGTDNVSITQKGAQTNAGENYTSTLVCGNTNYEIKSNASTTYTISPKEINIVWNADSVTYNGEYNKPTNTITGVLTKDDANISYSNQGKFIGDYTVSVSVGNSNYTIASGNTKNYSILPKTLTITWGSTSLTYNGSVQQPTYNAIGKCGTDNLAITQSEGNKDVGSYTSTLECGNDNYQITSNASKAYTINKKTLTITWVSTSLTYNGSIQQPSYNVDGGCDGDNLQISQSTGNKNVGSYTSTLECENNNYQITSNASKAYTINKKTLTVNWNYTTSTYDGNEHYPTFTWSGLEGTDSFEVEATYPEKINAGTYVATLSTIPNTNYQYPSGKNTYTYTINKKTLTVNWSYTTATYDGNEHYPTFTWSGLEGTDSFEVEATYPEKINAGTYVATLSTIPNANYQYPSGKNTYTYTINKKTLTVNWSYEEATYDGNEHKPECSITNGLVVGDSCNLNITYSNKVNAGNQKATITGTTNSNYEVTSSLTYNYVINKKTLEITWDASTSFTYNGNIQKPSYNVEGGCAGDNLQISQSTGNKNVGSYTSTLTCGNNNYQITSNASKAYTISKKVLTVNWSYTQATYDGNEHKPECSITNGLVVGDSCNLNITYSNKVNAGNHTATITGTTNSNYEVTSSLTYNYVIEKATIDMSKVTWNYTNEFEEDGTTHTVSLTNVPSLVSVSYTNNSKKEAGTYTAIASFEVSDNYNDIEDMELTWKIVEKEGE